ncbi:MAG TPA: PD-(D/E)XK nuclease family protein [Chloroflexaceae bacterium]|mgnify:CR=1 FL=1|nr:PD-(D/E)XK nuclease family protein [Chloroflexaceae bacterium]
MDDLDDAPVAPEVAEALLAALDAFAAWLAPPPEATPGAYVAWLRRLLGWASAGGREGQEEAEPDRAAPAPASPEAGPTGREAGAGAAAEREPHPVEILRSLRGLRGEGADAAQEPDGVGLELLPFSDEQRAQLRRILAEREAIGRLLGEGPRPYGAFLAELGSALDAARYGAELPGPGRVAVLPMLAARGQVFDHVLVLGASDGAVPAPLPEPPFYTRRERALLAARGGAPAPADPGDERAIFYEAALRARRSLSLSYTRLDEGGNPLEPSPYLTALAGLFAAGSVPVTTILAGSAPATEEAASPQEALVAAASGGTLWAAPPGAPPELAAHVGRAAMVERRREGLEPHGAHEGVVGHPAVAAALARRYGPGHSWSATQINDYTTCPFRFAAAHLLGLGRRGDPDEGLERAGRGRLAHAILARAGEAWARLEGAFDATSEGPVLAALSAAADEVLAEAPQRYGFEPGPLWGWEQAELRAALARAVARALRAEGWAGFRPAGFEEGFGGGRGQPPLRVPTDAGEALVVGRIDRVDQDAAGNLALIDYKSGGGARSLRETVEGRDVQLTIYALAAEGLGRQGQKVVRAAYLALGSGRLSAPLTPAERPMAEAALRERLGAAVAGARAGAFAVRPSDGCPPGCAYATICRVNPEKAGG